MAFLISNVSRDAASILLMTVKWIQPLFFYFDVMVWKRCITHSASQICSTAAFAERPLEKTCTHTHTHISTSEWSISFSHQSLSQSESEVHICCCLICIPGWWENSSLGLPLTADPNPSLTTGQPCAFIILQLPSTVKKQNLSCSHAWKPWSWMCCFYFAYKNDILPALETSQDL